MPIDWGKVEVGYEVERRLLLANEGDAACPVEVEVEGSFRPDTVALVVPAASGVTLPIRWRPARLGAEQGALLIAGDEKHREVPLAGEAVAVCMRALLPAIDFGEVAPFCIGERVEVRFENRCSHPVRVERHAFDEQPPWPDDQTWTTFALTRMPSLPSDLEAGGTMRFEMAFGPAAPGAHTETLHVIESSRRAAYAVLHGTATYREMQSDRYAGSHSSRYFLTGRPADADFDGAFADDMVLRLDGEAIPPILADGTPRWAYQSPINAVDLFGWFPPEESTLEISYFDDSRCR